MNWSDLKKFCNSLSEQQLENKVIMWREDEAINKIEAETLSENHYADPELGENICFPESEASAPIENLEKVYDKGFPILMEDF